jgi:alanyl-tRNA synthetase
MKNQTQEYQYLFLKDTYLFNGSAQILGTDTDEKGIYILFNQTIFYPQGGGQPSDLGTVTIKGLSSIPIGFVRQVNDEIRHYVSEPLDSQWIGSSCAMQIDSKRRLENARYHTAAHLLGHIVEEWDLNLKAVKGHSFPGEAYVEWTGVSSLDPTQVHSELQNTVNCGLPIKVFEIFRSEFEDKFYVLPYPIPDHKAFRAVQIGEFPPIPCGGTHLTNTQEIGDFKIRKVTQKGDRLKISYDLQ